MSGLVFVSLLVKDVIKKYSNFVGTDVILNGQKTNQLRPVWLMDPKVRFMLTITI